MKFPIFKIDKNQITSMNGEHSLFYEIRAKDYEIMTGDSFDICKEVLANKLNQVGEEEWFKYYRIGGRFYLNSSEYKEQFLNHKLDRYDDPLSIIFSGDGEVLFADDYFSFNQKHYRILTVAEFPSLVNLFEFADLGDYVVKFKKQRRKVSKRKLSMKRKLHYSSLFENFKNIESEEAYRQAERLLEEVTRSEDSIFVVEISFLVSGADKKEVDLATKELMKEFENKEGRLRVEKSALAALFNELVPGIKPSFRRNVFVPGNYLSNLFMLHQDRLMMEGIIFHSQRDEEVKIDLFDKASMNFNLLITGSSGQGKSVLGNKIIHEEIKRGTQALILDKGNSFLKTAQYHGGAILTEKFNPLQFRDPLYLKEFVMAVVEEKWERALEGKLLETIREIVTIKELNMDLFISELKKVFPDIHYYFAELLPYFKGEVTEIEKVVYADLSLYPDRIKAPLIIYLIEYFKNLSGQKIFLFDECWELLLQNARYIAECFRTFRKHNASAIAISQGLEDFTKNDIGRVIFQNSHYRAFFRQDVSGVDLLSDSTKQKVESLQSIKDVRSELLFSFGDVEKRIRYYTDKLEFELFNSDHSRKEGFQYYFQEEGRFLPFKDAFDNYVEIKNPNWRGEDV